MEPRRRHHALGPRLTPFSQVARAGVLAVHAKVGRRRGRRVRFAAQDAREPGAGRARCASRRPNERVQGRRIRDLSVGGALEPILRARDLRGLPRTRQARAANVGRGAAEQLASRIVDLGATPSLVRREGLLRHRGGRARDARTRLEPRAPGDLHRNSINPTVPQAEVGCWVRRHRVSKSTS